MPRRRLTSKEWIEARERQPEPRYSDLQIAELKTRMRMFWIAVALVVAFGGYQIARARTWDRASEVSSVKSQRVFIGGACESVHFTRDHLVTEDYLDGDLATELETRDALESFLRSALPEKYQAYEREFEGLGNYVRKNFVLIDYICDLGLPPGGLGNDPR